MNEHEAQDADGVDIFRSSPEHDSGRRGDGPSTADTEPSASASESAQGLPDAPKRRSRVTRVVGLGVAAVVLLGVGAGGGALAAEGLQASQHPTAAMGRTGGRASSGGAGSAGVPWGSGSHGWSAPPGSGSNGSGGFGPNGGTFGGFGAQGPGSGSGFGFGSQGSPGDAGGTAATATAAQERGVVTVVSTLGYASGEAAGTGIVLTSSGEILTNNHVIEGSTSVQVTVESTGRSYTARVVGTDPTDDVAVLQLKNASGLTPATLASTPAAVGDQVTAVGNAGGTGTLSAASGSVTDLQQSITTQAEGSAASESLTGLIETDADIVAGDSGGPLENSSGAVVGIDTAASSGGTTVTGFAIPISTAERIAGTITSGSTSSSITLGYPAFLGVEVDPTSTGAGAGVAQALNGTPAAAAGLSAGDVITAVDGKPVGSASALSTLLHRYSPGDSVHIGYTDQSGASHTVTVTLTSGPAD